MEKVSRVLLFTTGIIFLGIAFLSIFLLNGGGWVVIIFSPTAFFLITFSLLSQKISFVKRIRLALVLAIVATAIFFIIVMAVAYS